MPPQYAPTSYVNMTFVVVTLKVVSESCVTWATNFSLPTSACSRLRPEVREARQRHNHINTNTHVIHTYRHTDIHTYTHTHWQTHRHLPTPTKTHTAVDTQIDFFTATQTDTYTHQYTHSSTNKCYLNLVSHTGIFFIIYVSVHYSTDSLEAETTADANKPAHRI